MLAEDPLHAEAVALLHTLQLCISQPHTLESDGVQVLSDCKVLVNAVNSNSIQDLPSWKAADTVAQCGRLAQNQFRNIQIRHVTREAAKGPHEMSNWARRNQQNSGGLIDLIHSPWKQLERHLNPEFILIEAFEPV